MTIMTTAKTSEVVKYSWTKLTRNLHRYSQISHSNGILDQTYYAKFHRKQMRIPYTLN